MIQWLAQRILHWAADHAFIEDERALVVEEARRLKLRNDVLERLLERRDAKEALTPVAIWTVNVDVAGDRRIIRVALSQNNARRGWEVMSSTRRDGSDGARYKKEQWKDFLESNDTFVRYVNPWVLFGLQTSALYKCDSILPVGTSD